MKAIRVGRLWMLVGLLALLSAPAWGQAGFSVTLEPGWQLPSDTKAEGGDIVNPIVCPADSNWVSWEVHDESEVSLFVYNRETHNRRRITSASSGLLSGTMGSQVDCDLAWRPMLHNGDIWLAFIAEANRHGNLYLYNLTKDKYYQLARPTLDSLATAKMEAPAWSPDGFCLTYTTNLYGNKDIFILRNMERWLDDPTHKEIPSKQQLLVGGDGDQFRGVWNPVLGTGLLAYTHYNNETDRYEVRICDAKEREKREDPYHSYKIVDIAETRGSFGPTWSPSGSFLGFYRYDMDNNGKRASDTLGDSYDLVVGSVVPDCVEDTFMVSTKIGGAKSEKKILRVACNRNRLRGPAWLSSNQLLVSMFDAYAFNPLRVIDIFEWGLGQGQTWWLGELSEHFQFPSDAMVVGNTVTFTFQEQMRRNLFVGNVRPSETYGGADTLTLCSDRLGWWKSYRVGKAPGRPWWNRPIAGPDLFINRPVGIGAVGVTLGILCLTGVICDDDPPPPPGRDWDEPGLDDAASRTGRHIRISVGF